MSNTRDRNLDYEIKFHFATLRYEFQFIIWSRCTLFCISALLLFLHQGHHQVFRRRFIHKRKCRYLGYNLDIGYYTDFNADYAFWGYEFCICSKNAYDEVIMQPLDPSIKKIFKLRSKVRRYKGADQFSQKAVTEMCVLFGLNFELLTPYILIKSNHGTWKIFHNNIEVTEVRHSNHANGFETEGFHRKKIYRKDLYGTLTYISNHDQGIFDRKGRLKTDEKDKKQKQSANKQKHVSNCRRSKYKQGKRAGKRPKRDYIPSNDDFEDDF